MRPGAIPLWIWWIPVVWLVSFPAGFTPDPQWERVTLVPFSSPADKLKDLAVNVVLFVPFGYWQGRAGTGSIRVGLAAAAVSISAEVLQLFSTVRFPSASDVLYAVSGALAGWALRRRRAARGG